MVVKTSNHIWLFHDVQITVFCSVYKYGVKGFCVPLSRNTKNELRTNWRNKTPVAYPSGSPQFNSQIHEWRSHNWTSWHPRLLRPFLGLGFAFTTPTNASPSPARNHPPPGRCPNPSPAAQCIPPSHPNRAHQPLPPPRAIRLCRIDGWHFRLHSWSFSRSCDTDSIRIHLSRCISTITCIYTSNS